MEIWVQKLKFISNIFMLLKFPIIFIFYVIKLKYKCPKNISKILFNNEKMYKNKFLHNNGYGAKFC